MPVATEKGRTPPLAFGAREGAEAAIVVVVAQNKRSTPPHSRLQRGMGWCWPSLSSPLPRTEEHPPLAFAAREGVVLAVVVV